MYPNFTSFFGKIIFPADLSSKLQSIESKVDFPQPEGPTMATNSPSLIFKFKSLIASVSPSLL